MRQVINLQTGEVTQEEDAPVVEQVIIPPTTGELLAASDVWMSRVTEDTVVALVQSGIIKKEQYAPIVIDRINYRRNLRNQPPL